MPRLVTISLIFGLLTLSGLARAEQGAERDRSTDAARHAYELADAGLTAGTSSPEVVYLWSVRWMISKANSCPSCGGASTAAHLDRMRALARRVAAMVAAGTASPLDHAACAYYLAEAERWASRGRGPG